MDAHGCCCLNMLTVDVVRHQVREIAMMLLHEDILSYGADTYHVHSSRAVHSHHEDLLGDKHGGYGGFWWPPQFDQVLDP